MRQNELHQKRPTQQICWIAPLRALQMEMQGMFRLSNHEQKMFMKELASIQCQEIHRNMLRIVLMQKC